MERGSLAHVVGLGLERQAEHPDALAPHVPVERAADLVAHASALGIVDRDRRLDDPRRHVPLPRDSGERRDVLRKARAAEAGPGVEEPAPDAPIEAHAPRHCVHVGPRRLAQRRDLVDEAHLGREEGVARVLGELRALDPGREDRGLDEVEGAIELAQQPLRPGALHPEHDPVGAHEVLDRRPLPEELGVGGHVEIRIGTGVLHQPPDLAGGADGYRRLGHDHRVAAKMRRERRRRLVHVPEIGVAVAAPCRGADRDEHEVRRPDLGPRADREPESPGGGVASDEVLEPRLVEWNLPRPEPVHPVLVGVHARHVRPELGEARAGHEPDVAGPDHDHPHGRR